MGEKTQQIVKYTYMLLSLWVHVCVFPFVYKYAGASLYV